MLLLAEGEIFTCTDLLILPKVLIPDLNLQLAIFIVLVHTKSIKTLFSKGPRRLIPKLRRSTGALSARLPRPERPSIAIGFILRSVSKDLQKQ